MDGKKAVKNKLLIYVCALVIGIMSVPVTAYAADGLASLAGIGMDKYVSVTIVEGNRQSDGNFAFTGSVSDEVYVTIYPSNGYFFADGKYNIYYQYTVDNYRFNTWITNSLSSNEDVTYYLTNPTYSFSLISNDKEILLDSTMNGWFQMPSDIGESKAAMTLKVKYAYNYVIVVENASIGGCYNVLLEPYAFFDFSVWDEYSYEDYYVRLMTEVESISNDTSGLQGTIDNQTTIIQQESQKEQELQQEGNQLQEEANTLQEEANETSKNIFEKITDFFDNFFSRLGDFLLGLIVPSSDDLTAFLNEVNDWFSERLGFIWYPFSFAVDAVSALAGGTADTGITVPALTLNMFGGTYTIWNEMQVDLDAFGIFRYVRLFTSFICVGGIVALAYNKWDEWIGGHGVG